MITLIAAIAQNNCIGIAGKLPWHIPEDMARFKTLTMGHVVLMGRKIWEAPQTQVEDYQSHPKIAFEIAV